MAKQSIDQRHALARQTLQRVGQEHVLQAWDRLDEQARDRLLKQIEGIDWEELGRLIQSHVLAEPDFSLRGEIKPAPFYPRQPGRQHREKYRKARKQGIQLLKQGKVAAFTVAGGQGTRLGWNGPKGTFPATPIRKLPLFAVLAEYIVKAQKKFGSTIPWYIMTSPLNDQATRAFFEQSGYFGLDPENVMLFPQGMMPAISLEEGPGRGKALMESVDRIALSPNGHGGSLKALYQSSAVADMRKRGVEHISYVQIDNPLVKVVDPLFIGLHALDQAQMSSKMIPKAYPKEKLGNFALVDGRMTVIEYSDLPDDLAEQRLDNGELRFLAGSIAIHMIKVGFVESLNKKGGFALPWHRAVKKVPYVDLNTAARVEPDKPNAVKLETFVFDALSMTENAVTLETERVEEFAPIKNADAPGAVDTPGTSKALQTLRAARWLKQHGVKIPMPDENTVNAVIELSQLTAIEPEDLEAVELPDAVEPGTQLLL